MEFQKIVVIGVGNVGRRITWVVASTGTETVRAGHLGAKTAAGGSSSTRRKEKE